MCLRNSFLKRLHLSPLLQPVAEAIGCRSGYEPSLLELVVTTRMNVVAELQYPFPLNNIDYVTMKITALAYRRARGFDKLDPIHH